MSWDEQLFALFDDLEQQAKALYDANRAEELADRSRSEYAAVSLVSRLMASMGPEHAELTLDLLGLGRVTGRVGRIGPDWCLVHGVAQDWVVRLAVVKAVVGASDRSVPEVAWSPVSRLGLGSALRRLADAWVECRLHTLDGQAYEGRLCRVGSDFVEVRLARGRSALVATATLAAVQSRE